MTEPAAQYRFTFEPPLGIDGLLINKLMNWDELGMCQRKLHIYVYIYTLQNCVDDVDE